MPPGTAATTALMERDKRRNRGAIHRDASNRSAAQKGESEAAGPISRSSGAAAKPTGDPAEHVGERHYGEARQRPASSANGENYQRARHDHQQVGTSSRPRRCPAGQRFQIADRRALPTDAAATALRTTSAADGLPNTRRGARCVQLSASICRALRQIAAGAAAVKNGRTFRKGAAQE